MMKIEILTAFPDMVTGALGESMIKRARDKDLVEISVHHLRDYTTDKHHKVDDYPYGGGAGMVMKAEPFFLCLDQLTKPGFKGSRKIIHMSPQGETFSQKTANDLTVCDHMIFLCGHYKGIDQRVIDAWVTDEISIGDYVVTGGELPALVVIDAVVRLIPGVLSDLESAETDTFQQPYFDCPYYTRPEEYRGFRVPDVLLSGHHERIEHWRKQQSINRTLSRRKDLMGQSDRFDNEQIIMEEKRNG